MRFLSTQVRAWRVGVLFLVLSTALIGGWLMFVKATEPVYCDLRCNMSMAEVTAVMGEPDFLSTDGDWTRWSFDIQHWGGDHTVDLYFEDGRLVGSGGKGPLIEQ